MKTDLLSNPSDWTTWAPRLQLAPRFRRDGRTARTGGGSAQAALQIVGERPHAFGAWRRTVEVVPGRSYRLEAFCRTRNIGDAGASVGAAVRWLDANNRPHDGTGNTTGAPDDALPAGPADPNGWTRWQRVVTAPDGARRARIELSLGWCAKPSGTVWWDDVSFTPIETPAGVVAGASRIARVATIYHRPQNTGSPGASVAQFCRVVREQAARHRPDVVCLPEGITLIGTGKTFADIAEPVPGPTTRTLGETAKALNCYLVAGLIERARGDILHNTAVLLGRDGRLIGTYRKTHLPREEAEAGLTPGDAYPVFRTDFGTVGLLVCWDVQFPEPARELARAGAEIILLPIWGGSEVLARARAIENHVFLVSSSYDMRTFVVDPTGAVLAEASKDQPVAAVELFLDRPIHQPWLGDMKARTWRERRSDIAVQKGP